VGQKRVRLDSKVPAVSADSEYQCRRHRVDGSFCVSNKSPSCDSASLGELADGFPGKSCFGVGTTGR